MERKLLVEKLEKQAKQLRKHVVEMVGVGNTGHIGGSCSCCDIVTALYFSKMKLDPKDPNKVDRDRFLLSKGHAAIIQYAALAECGFFDISELKKVKTIGAMLQGHPDYRRTPGVEANTGSLGQGLSIGLGMALGLRLSKINSKVYVILGDGEMAEGQNWEAAMAASHYKADNLVAILDRNKLQAMGSIEERFNTNPIIEKWESFGFHVIEIDGHDMNAILDALDLADTITDKPKIIVANTIKGKGISFAENVVSYHNGSFTEETYAQAIQELS